MRKQQCVCCRDEFGDAFELCCSLAGQAPSPPNLTPPRSPDLGTERGKEFKENREPSPKVKRRRSVKISNVGLEVFQLQHDTLQIITCANDFKCMNEFLQKKVNMKLYVHQSSDLCNEILAEVVQ